MNPTHVLKHNKMKINYKHPLAKRFFVRMYPDYRFGTVSSNRLRKMQDKATDAANECLEMLKFYHVFIATKRERIFDDYLLDEFFELALFRIREHALKELSQSKLKP